MLNIASIRTRLTLFYTLAAFTLLTLVALFLYWVTINILYKADYEFLSDEVDTIQYILETKPLDINMLKEAVVDTPGHQALSIYHYYVRVLDEQKQLLVETPGMSSILQPKKYIHSHSELLDKKRYFWLTNKDTHYLLIQAPVKINKNMGLIQIALNISYQHSTISDRKKWVASLLIGTLCSLLVGFFIANRGMRSLYLLTETVQKITTASLHERIDPNSWPKELVSLGVAFNHMLDRMEASFARLKQFSADLSHELRTPVTNLIGETEMALTYSQTVEDSRQAMASNLEELHRMSSLIENILFLAKAENPRVHLQKNTISVHDEIALVCDYYQAMADDKNIQLISDGKAELTVNSVMFRRMTSNLLSNAIKYTPPGGRIAFTVSELDNHTVQIVLNDNGLGIAPEHLPHIFDRFYRVDASRSHHLGGAGLGLAIVKSIVDLHHGMISIVSELNQGTTITVSFSK